MPRPLKGLMLSRKQQESLRLTCPDGTEVWIGIVEIRGTRVRLSIEAPTTVKVLREEVIGQRPRGAIEDAE